MLGTMTTIITYNAIVPRATNPVLYCDIPGTTAAHQPTLTKESATVVTMCATTKSSASKETLRCNVWVAKCGHDGPVSARCVDATPSIMLKVSSTKAITAVDRVVYQSGASANAEAADIRSPRRVWQHAATHRRREPNRRCARVVRGNLGCAAIPGPRVPR